MTTTTTTSGSTGPTASELFAYHLGDPRSPLPISTRAPRDRPATTSCFLRPRFQRPRHERRWQIDISDASVTGDTGGLTLDFGNGDTLTVAHVSALHDDDLLFS